MNIDNQIQEYVVTARKWRPQNFRDVVGQEHITKTLENAIKNNRHHHAYLFSGPRGVGKTTTARILARALNCTNLQGAEPCNECESCVSILEGRSLDVIEIDGASNNSVEDIRKLRENSRFTPSVGKYKLYIIDEVHMLSTSAFNALLKTLEEPPPHLKFVFATTESHKLPATILSRCQRFDFRRMEIEKITGHLRKISEKENITIDDEALFSIAKKADGSMRDSQSIFDQVVAFCGNNISYTSMADALHLIDQDFFFRISRAILEKNISEMFDIVAQVAARGFDMKECLAGLLEHFRNILAIKVSGNYSFVETSQSTLERYSTEAELFRKADLLRILNMVSATESTLQYSQQPKIKFELTLIQLASLDSAVEIHELLSDIKNLKAGNISIPTTPTPTPHAEPPLQAVPKPIANASTQDTTTKPTIVQNLIQKSLESTETHKPAHLAASVAAEHLQSHWQGFLAKYANGDTGLYALNQPIVHADFMNGEIILHVQDNFYLNSLNNKKLTLKDYLNEYYGCPVEVKVILSETPTATQEQSASQNFNSGDSTSPPQEQKSESTNKENNGVSSIKTKELTPDEIKGKHPTEVAILQHFNAKEIFV